MCLEIDVFSYNQNKEKIRQNFWGSTEEKTADHLEKKDDLLVKIIKLPEFLKIK